MIMYAPDMSQVYLNNQFKGETKFLQTFWIRTLNSSIYNLRITKAGFIDYVRDIPVEMGKTADIVADMKLKPTTNGILSINTYPNNSSIYLDEIFAGTGPLWLPNVTPENHVLRVTYPGYLDWNKQVNVIGNGRVTYISAALYPPWWTLFQVK